MNIKLSYLVTLIMITSVLVFNGCKEEEPELAQLVVGFQSTSLGIDLDSDEVTSVIEFSRNAEENGEVVVNITNESSTSYGETADYETEPAAANNTITIPYTAGDNQVSFKIIKRTQIAFGETKAFTLSIASVGENGTIGNNGSQAVTFAENPVSSGSNLEPEVGGPTQSNTVFIDLSKQSSVSVARDSWDFGFYAGAEFRVILNSSVHMMAQPLDKFLLAEVNSSDTSGFAATMNLNCFCADASWIDDPNGDLENTAIAEISATDEENAVYIIQRGSASDDSPRGWVKIRVLRDGDGYTLRYAEIDDTDYNEISVDKNSDASFNFVHLEDGLVTVEPEVGSWDISFTNHTEYLNFGGGLLPYGFKDMVIQNRVGVESVQVMEDSDIMYETFTFDDASGLSLETGINAIGSNWRHTAPPDPADIFTDRFYLVKDADGNLYKVRFTQLKDPDSGERGFPEFEYALLTN